ncbi:MAG: argininosuccinate lyase [Endomicrobiales bacterium]
MENCSEFINSYSFDKRLVVHDIIGSLAHVKMLVKCKIIPASDGSAISKGLSAIRADIEKGKSIAPEEDIHYAVEKELIRRIGPVGGKMHTGRSRNDQVALDIRLYVRDEINRIEQLLHSILKEIVGQAEKNSTVIMPGYTHLQPAQPVLWAHHIMAYGWMFQRDIQRLDDCLKRVNILPLGSAALAGTSFAIDRRYVARLLGFDGVSENSMDAVSDRDFIIEFLAASSIIAMHVSRLCEELVIWSSAEFNFVRIADEFISGSSIMPQKRNPDVAEIARGKTGRVYGNLMAVLTLMKGMPLCYNRDMQEDKPPVFDTVDTLTSCLTVIGNMIATLEINPARMISSTERGFLAATEVADYLAKKKMPFRQAHGIVKEIVLYCIENKCTLSELSMAQWQHFSSLIKSDIRTIIDPRRIVETKQSEGGTSRSSVLRQINALKKICL